jgi:hypothetical protein
MDSDTDDSGITFKAATGKLNIPELLVPDKDRFIEPPKYFSFKDMTQGGDFKYSQIAVRVTEDDVVAVTFIVEQLRRFYTHSRNRRVWTGPYFVVEILDQGGFPVGQEWYSVQINKICGQRSARFVKETSIVGSYDLSSKVNVHASSYRSWGC